MHIPHALRPEYRAFLNRTGFDNDNPQALLMELASISLELYIREVAWLSDFLGRIEAVADRPRTAARR
ncbi:hypothetical protein GCM10011316_31060 [Roseibium aquae]|uniref:Uncharacterized protein n=1 Tax=Roseibium aquae TaxID=1323746 RepID=A0A916TLI2_9HYPH|nr:hypothetical protein [Roseibium aquae]GGB56707.1 hypothetical protein GCM10011316_31060 [Roseibium aquae]